MQTIYRTVARWGLLMLLVAGFTAEARAQAAGAFARMGFGARGIAMGNALVADASGDVSPYYNPALAPFASGQNVSASAGLLTFDRQLQFLQFATPLKPRAGLAVGLIHAGVTHIDGRDGSGFHTRDLSTDEFAVFLAFGTRLGERLTGGIGLQLFRTDAFEGLQAVNSIGLDLGLTARVTDALHLGLTVDDLLARYSWDTSDVYGSAGKSTSDRFPTRLRVGGAYDLAAGRARLTAEYEARFTSVEHRTTGVGTVGDVPRTLTAAERLKLRDGRLRLGGEYLLTDAFALRGGLDGLGEDGLDALRPTAGFMIAQPVGSLLARVEYAFMLEPYAVGTAHYITLRVFL